MSGFPFPLDRVLARRPLARRPLGAAPGAPGDEAPRGFASWQHVLNPPDRQVGSSCGGNALENFAEIALRRDAPEPWLHEQVRKKLGHLRWRVNGDGLYALARREFRGAGDSSEGLFQDEITRIPEISGIFGHHGVRRIARGWAVRHRVLLDGPICLPLAITRIWADGWDRKTGYLPAETAHEVGGHEVCIVAGYAQGGRWYDVPQNSWGDDWGVHGCVLIDGEWTDWMQMEDGTQWILEEGWWKRGTILDWIVESKAA